MSALARQLEGLLQAAEADGRGRAVIEILALLALAYDLGGLAGQSAGALARALERAEPEGYIRTFLDCGAPMRALLLAQRQRLPHRGPGAAGRAYLHRLLSARAQGERRGDGEAAARPRLSARELNVLQLIAAGHTVDEIALRLMISSSTVRTHMKHIYAKLQSHNRVETLTAAQALGLL